jgi:2-polyprenyl-3-methyl-5-hydroxy-6-metoxy-1,4-benzoquinol methylase
VTETPQVQTPAEHWDGVFTTADPTTVSWYEPRPVTSLRLLSTVATPGSAVVDIGAGESLLADRLLDDGWSDVTVLDVSAEALAVVRRRLAGRNGVSFVTTDVLDWSPDRSYDAWHDRAVFHFLVTAEARACYAAVAAAAVRPGGALVIATFAADGPSQCSGLPTMQYDADALAAELGDAFGLEHAEREEHVTPSGIVQPFTWAVLRRRAP